MKKTYIGFAGLSLLLLLGTQTVQAQQGFGTDKPNKSAAVDIKSSKRGLLIPRVNLKSTIDAKTIVSPAQSLMVYNQATTTSGTNDVTPGYYYWDIDRWARFAKQSEIIEIELKGDVTGKTGDTKVVAIQGTSISNATPTANQVLTLVNGVWTPTTITSSLISDAKGITGTGITVGGTDNGAGSVLKEVTLSITHGRANQVMVTNADGNGTTWVDQSVISPTTTNKLTSVDNTITSNVNGVSETANIVNTIENTFDQDNKLVTTVNGKSGEGLDLTPAIQAGQKTTSVVKGSDKVTVVTTGAGTKGKNTEYTVDVVEANIKLENLGGELPVNKLVKGNDGQVLITKDGVSTWVDQSDIVPTTTNTLTKKDNNGTVDSNTIVSTVNGEPAEVKVIDNVTNTINGTSIVTSVNGVSSGSVDLKDAIQAGQKITTVVDGTNTTVSSSVNPAGSNTTEYKVHVSNDAIQAAQKLTTVSEGNGVKVTPADKGNNTTDYNVAINTDGGNAGDVLTVVKDGDTNTKVEWKKPEEYKNIYNSDGTLTSNRTVDFGKNTSLIFEKGSQSHGFTYDPDHTGLNMYGDKTSSIGLISNIESTNGIESKLKLNHDNDWSYINSSADKGFKLSTYYSKNISFETYKTYDGNSSALINLVIHGDGGVQVNNINKPEFAGESTNKVVVADADGVLKTVERAKVAPQFFYMPAVIFDTKSKGTGLVRDLYKEYVDQFTGGKVGVGNANYNIAHGAGGYTMPYTGGIVGSDGAPADIAVFDRGELHYYVTYYDTEVFKNLEIDKDGKLTYDIVGNATPASYMNIVFVIK
ncbi:hypothetical protein [Myroides odoratimimus]|uniref:hypothetical protein n=1 Tax=Myroides odoratimimus TaxID=76832 RepID=UPI001CE22B7C|nr:hypothetical protein [Myroides odoratimimus]MCA4807256.1 hypothetical protein [Myroides odoratimimus]MDM1093589.1 hypothetical protein [Myroides odoratimimus]MDM1400998.1 hypothetical protein [Myroides odoratimimus]MDM1411223.1 hypothetical protein [Myroides odoratimimus]MDM1464213.1 hypothetical protein [Myroides odoratimimus]